MSSSEGLAKPNRFRDQSIMDYVKTLPCVICGSSPSDPDHITSKGAGGHDLPENLWPLCHKHHVERHNAGLKSLIRKYHACREWLEMAGRDDILESVSL